MTALVPIFVAVINAVAALGPQLLGFFDRVRQSADLSADGKALLDSMSASIESHAKKAEATEPLPVPPPTAPR